MRVQHYHAHHEMLCAPHYFTAESESVKNRELNGLSFWGVFRPRVGMASTWLYIKYSLIDWNLEYWSKFEFQLNSPSNSWQETSCHSREHIRIWIHRSASTYFWFYNITSKFPIKVIFVVNAREGGNEKMNSVLDTNLTMKSMIFQLQSHR